MGDTRWGGDNGEYFERGDDEVGGGIGSEEWLFWKLSGDCGVVGKMGEGFGNGGQICLGGPPSACSSLLGRRLE